MSVIPALKSWRQEDRVFRVIFGYTVVLRLAWGTWASMYPSCGHSDVSSSVPFPTLLCLPHVLSSSFGHMSITMPRYLLREARQSWSAKSWQPLSTHAQSHHTSPFLYNFSPSSQWPYSACFPGCLSPGAATEAAGLPGSNLSSAQGMGSHKKSHSNTLAEGLV